MCPDSGGLRGPVMPTKAVLLVFLAALWSPSLGDLSTAPITTDWIPRVSRKMTTFAESQTGALQLVQEYDDKLSFTQTQIDGQTELHLLTRAAGDRLKKCREILHRNKAEIEASHAQGPAGGASASDCCDNLGQLEYDPRFLQQIVNDSCATFTDAYKGPNPTSESRVQPHVYDTMKSNLHQMSGVTWQYYGAKEGEYHQFPKSDRPCQGSAHVFRNWYVSAASPKKKNVVIVIDVSRSMHDANRINLAKQAALTVLDTLTARDWAGVVSFSEETKTPQGCFGDIMAEANPGNIDIMRDFINNLSPESSTYYARGFKKAFDIFYAAKQNKPEQFVDSNNVIIFLTDGKPSDTDDVLDQITESQYSMNRSVHIFTYGLGNALQGAYTGWCADPNDRQCTGYSVPPGFEDISPNTHSLDAIEFLATIADQNNMRIPGAVAWTNEDCRQNTYGPCLDSNRNPQGVGPSGRTDNVGDGEGDKLMTMMGSYYDFFQSEPEPTFLVPTKDEHLGLTITGAIRTTDSNGEFLGVTAVDMSVDIVFNEIVNFNLGLYSHAFLVDREDGRVLIHRDLPKPMEWPSDPTFLHLNAMKGVLLDDEVYKILNGESGSCSHNNVKVPVTRGDSQFDGVFTLEKPATFYYEPIPDSKYSVVLCLFDEDRTITVPNQVFPENGTETVFHQLDLSQQSNATCRLYGNYATMDGSAVMFPPEAYTDPIGYLSSVETAVDVANIEQFLNDLTGSVDNPGLLDGVRTDVILTSAIEQYWRQNASDSVWRYVGTRNGMFRIFPGIALDRRYDPTQQGWYKRALSRPNDYTFSRPVPSPFGGGNMVTISRVIANSGYVGITQYTE
ncbi:VWFA and cache domain-containing protein 1-like [Branchiostoma floridae x Branchiostoma belcheri]